MPAPVRPATEAEIIPPAKTVQAPNPEAGPAHDEGVAMPAGVTNANGANERAAQSVPGASAGALKPEARKLKIFVPGPAPDDPGPALAEGDDLDTHLSRFRGPSQS
jgi:hypothetical protein